MQGLRLLRPNAAQTERNLAVLGSCYIGGAFSER
jgi:hypothetical protein